MNTVECVVCTVDISTEHYTWSKDAVTMPTQPTQSQFQFLN